VNDGAPTPRGVANRGDGDPFRFADDLGPKTFVHLTERTSGLRAVVVIDNVAAGPAIGGTRMAPDVTAAECFALARAMTLKNAAAGLPHGGAKSVIRADPHMDIGDKERLVRAFAGAIADLTDYIPGPDMGTDELAMGWVRDEIGRAVGLPAELGGIPLDELGATGFGLAVAADVAAPRAGLDLDGARVAVQGFGSVGVHAARFLAERGCRLVAASDSTGGVVDASGLDIDALVATKRAGRGLVDQPDVDHVDRDELIGVDCDVWVPAARPDAIRADNVDRLRARVVVQGANIGVTREAEDRLQGRGVVSVPDFIANAGGVICAAVEYSGGSRTQAFIAIEDRIRGNVTEALDRAESSGGLLVDAAHEMAEARVRRAMTTRRWT
jgi:glutamate dehydrogenase (NAD(P)+)